MLTSTSCTIPVFYPMAATIWSLLLLHKNTKTCRDGFHKKKQKTRWDSHDIVFSEKNSNVVLDNGYSVCIPKKLNVVLDHGCK